MSEDKLEAELRELSECLNEKGFDSRLGDVLTHTTEITLVKRSDPQFDTRHIIQHFWFVRREPADIAKYLVDVHELRRGVEA